MARYSAGAKATAVGSTARGIISLWGATGSGGTVREIGITNSSSVNFDVVLRRLTAQGAGVGTNLTEGKQNSNSPAAAMSAYSVATVDHTVGDDLGYRASLGAAVGAGVVFTFGADGLTIPAGTANGIGLLLENGTAQAAQVYVVWDE